MSPSQELALDALLAGRSQTDAADAAGVSRETVNRWANRHPGFIAEFNRRRAERASHRDELASGLDVEAVNVVAGAVRDGNVNAAMAWLRLGLGRNATDEKERPTSPERVLDEFAGKEANKVLGRSLGLRALAARYGHATPDEVHVRQGLEAHLRAELGYPPVEVHTPVHWSERDRIPHGWLLVATGNGEAAERFASAIEANQFDGFVDVAPVGIGDIKELVEVLNDPIADGATFEQVPTRHPRIELWHLDWRSVRALAEVATTAIPDLALEWVDLLNEDLSPVEAAAIMATTVATARNLPHGHSLFLGTAVARRQPDPNE